MNRRRFLAMLGIIPALPLLAKLPKLSDPDAVLLAGKPTGLSLAKLKECASLLDGNVQEFMRFNFIRTDREVLGPPNFVVKQTIHDRPDRCHVRSITTTVSMNGKKPLYHVSIWDEIEDINTALAYEKGRSIIGTREYWNQRDRWTRKAQEAKWRAGYAKRAEGWVCVG